MIVMIPGLELLEWFQLHQCCPRRRVAGLDNTSASGFALPSTLPESPHPPLPPGRGGLDVQIEFFQEPHRHKVAGLLRLALGRYSAGS